MAEKINTRRLFTKELKLKVVQFFTTMTKIATKLPHTLSLIWVGFLGVRFEVEAGKITPCLKLVRIMLETSNLARKFTPKFSFRKYTF